MKVKDFLWQKSTRLVAFISACVIFATCAIVSLSKWFVLDNVYNKYEDISNSIRYDQPARDNLQELFSKLWVVGNMYYRNLDDNGKFTGSKELKASTETALKNLGLMDDNGNIIIGVYNDFNYYMSWGKNSISTGNKSYDDVFDSSTYSTTYTNGTISHAHTLGYFNYGGFKWYTTDYGMTYYDFPNYINGIGATATFDYDTTDLEYYTDYLGVKIYYKKDGSTPVPTPETNNIDMSVTYYNDYEEVTEPQYYDRYGNLIISESAEEITVPDIPKGIMKNDSSYLLYDKNSNAWVEVKNHNRHFGNETPLKICITPSDEILPLYKQYEIERLTAEKNMTKTVLGIIPFLVVAVLLMGFFVVTSGYDTKKKKFVLSATDNIWAEVVIAGGVLLGGGFFMSMMEIDAFSHWISDYHKASSFITPLYTTAWTTVFALVVLCVNSIVKRFKCRSFWKTTFVKNIWNFALKILKIVWGKIKSVAKTIQDAAFIRDMSDNSIFGRRLLIKLGLFMLAVIFSASLQAEMAVWLIIFGAYIFASLKDIKSVTELSRQISDIYGGDYTKKDVDKTSPTYTMTEKLNNISDGIQTAVDKKLQSEKMKIDLVTNVSHDLKTPLTSIISYINLLSDEEDLSPVARDYVKILEQKSARLSEIVSDVFDIAKATSRTDINFEMIDAVILTEQVFADMSDKIENSGRDIRKTISAETAPVFADGKRLYRVLQNIIDNALKYSLENTRIYIKLDIEDENAVITVKNISSYEIKFTPEELTERFTRGDEARTTEGNGLGLSIAKSFTEACGGKFNVDIDGDVFVVTVELPIKEKI
ncbi:MAG: HAMP domain-containing histidine kinase [Ruminococcus sp.]|nr:HAMP domain-containing histidine kinase [Ruminococcus sp.]